MAFALRLFGPLSVTTADGREVTPHSRKARALLAYCVGASPKPVRREHLIALLWDNRAEEQGRASLRQALYELRSVTGLPTSFLAIDRTSIHIASAQMLSDMDQLRLCAQGDDVVGLAALLGDRPDTPLEDLSGISEALDEWLRLERTRLGDERRSLVLASAEKALAGGTPLIARQLARAMLTFDPLDERAARLAMETSHALGDPADARRILLDLEGRLRRDLNVEPAPATLAVGARDHKGIFAPVAIPVSAILPAQTIAPSIESALPTPPTRYFRARFAAVTGLCLLIAIAGGLLLLWRLGNGDVERRLLQVEPLKVAASDHDAQLLRQSLSNDLTRMVVGQDTILQLSDQTDKIARSPPPDYVMTGEARSSSGNVYAAVRLIDGKRAYILWSQEFRGKVGDIDSVRQQIASGITGVLVCALGSRSRQPASIDLATLRLFLAGCENFRTDWPAALEFFRQVVERRPDFAKARGMYAASLYLNARTFSGLRQKEGELLCREAKAQAQKVLSLDPHVGAAYYALAGCSGNLAQWPAREVILKKGLTADPDAAELHTAMGVGLGNMGFTKAANEHFERAAALDPFAPIFNTNLAEALLYSGRVAEGMKMLTDAKTVWPGNVYTSSTRFEGVARVGDPRVAMTMLAHPELNSGYNPAKGELWRIFLTARIEHSPARIEAAAATLKAAATQSDLRGKVAIVQHFVQLGRIDDAYDLAMQIPSALNFGFIWFRDYMKPFRADPRFLLFAAKQGFVQIWKKTKEGPDFCKEDALRYRCPQSLEIIPKP
ncbi:hypothetical protein BH10PLA2_BH10PLA2_05400 [soil metagenome]